MLAIFTVALLLIRLIVTGRRLPTGEATLTIGILLAVFGLAIRNIALSIAVMLLALGIIVWGQIWDEKERRGGSISPPLRGPRI